MSQKGLCCGLYRGSFYMRDLGNPNSALVPVGNAEAEITQSMTEITTPNFQSLGGNSCKVEYPESVGLTMTLHCTKPDNLALAFLGEAIQKMGGTNTETYTVRDYDTLIAFETVPLKTTIVVTDGEMVPTAYTVNTDYVVTNAGIKIPEGSTIPLNSEIEVTYDFGKNWTVEAQTVSQKTFEVVLDGVNVGEDGNRSVVLKAWKVKFAPTDNFSLISGSDFASIQLSGEILRDESKQSGSKFFKIEFSGDADSAY